MAGVWEAADLPSSLLVIAPHPDDEVLGCGRLMQRVSAQGGRVVVVWMTDGGGSHGELEAGKRRELVLRRQREAVLGVLALGIAPEALVFLDNQDGALADADPEPMRRTLQGLCDAHDIETVAVTAGDDGHRDHRAAHAIARGLSTPRLVAYPVSARYDGEPYAAPGGALLIPPEPGDRKRNALRRHRSQRAAGGARYPLSEITIARFCSEPEMFIPIDRSAS